MMLVSVLVRELVRDWSRDRYWSVYQVSVPVSMVPGGQYRGDGTGETVPGGQ